MSKVGFFVFFIGLGEVVGDDLENLEVFCVVVIEGEELEEVVCDDLFKGEC